MTINSFKNRRAQIVNSLRKTNKGGAAFEMHINRLRILHVKAGAQIVKQAGKV